jgi:predicted branched-subunit amino acid permease
MSNTTQGLRIGIPIALGYFAVAFSLGIIAKQAGLTAAIGFVSSFFTRASAGYRVSDGHVGVIIRVEQMEL